MPSRMKRPLVVLLHGGYWLIYLLLLSVTLTVIATQATRTTPNLLSFIPLIVLFVGPNLISFYSFYFLLFSRFLRRRKILPLIIFGSIICALSAFSGLFLSLPFFGFGQRIFADAREFFTLLASFFGIAAIHGTIALVIRGFITWYDEIKLKEELTQRNFEMELALIKSQINPHFLFNTINNIDYLITKQPTLASAFLNKLSDILRYMVYETKTEKIPLAIELDYIEKYLELQKIRTHNPHYVNFKVAGEAGSLIIAPMILFPFIENAFKHTENKKSSNTIRIKVAIEKNKLVFESQRVHSSQACCAILAP